MKEIWKDKYISHLSSTKWTKWLLLIFIILNTVVAEDIGRVPANIDACENTDYTINWNYTRTVTNGIWSKDGLHIWIETAGSPPTPVVQAKGEDKIAYDYGAVVTLLNIHRSTHNGKYGVNIVDPSDSKTYSAETTLNVLRSPTGTLTCNKVNNDIVASGISDTAIMLFIKFDGVVVSALQATTVSYVNATCGTYQCCMSGSDSSVATKCYPGSTGDEYCIDYSVSGSGCSGSDVSWVCILCIVFACCSIILCIILFVYIKVKDRPRLCGGDIDIGLLVIFILVIIFTVVTFSLACASAFEADESDLCLAATIVGFVVSVGVFTFAIIYVLISTRPDSRIKRSNSDVRANGNGHHPVAAKPKKADEGEGGARTDSSVSAVSSSRHVEVEMSEKLKTGEDKKKIKEEEKRKPDKKIKGDLFLSK